MRREQRSKVIVAVLIFTSLALGGIAEAGGRLGEDMTPRLALRAEVSVIDQGLGWLAELWSDFKAVFSEDTAGSNPPPATNSCEAGPGIDPEGQC